MQCESIAQASHVCYYVVYSVVWCFVLCRSVHQRTVNCESIARSQGAAVVLHQQRQAMQTLSPSRAPADQQARPQVKLLVPIGASDCLVNHQFCEQSDSIEQTYL